MNTAGDHVVHACGWSVYTVLKVLGTAMINVRPVVHITGEKPGGKPVDNRWTTVDNGPVPTGCGRAARFEPGLSTT
jgi:hypothetical protein